MLRPTGPITTITIKLSDIADQLGLDFFQVGPVAHPDPNTDPDPDPDADPDLEPDTDLDPNPDRPS